MKSRLLASLIGLAVATSLAPAQVVTFNFEATVSFILEHPSGGSYNIVGASDLAGYHYELGQTVLGSFDYDLSTGATGPASFYGVMEYANAGSFSFSIPSAGFAWGRTGTAGVVNDSSNNSDGKDLFVFVADSTYFSGGVSDGLGHIVSASLNLRDTSGNALMTDSLPSTLDLSAFGFGKLFYQIHDDVFGGGNLVSLDATLSHLQIVAVPEPAASAVIIGGAVLLVIVLFRRGRRARALASALAIAVLGGCATPAAPPPRDVSSVDPENKMTNEQRYAAWKKANPNYRSEEEQEADQREAARKDAALVAEAQRAAEAERVRLRREGFFLSHGELPIERREAVRDGKIAVGMYEEEVLASWGEPARKYTSGGTGVEVITWVYPHPDGSGESDRLLFADGKLWRWNLDR